jgi:hypothetical protein
MKALPAVLAVFGALAAGPAAAQLKIETVNIDRKTETVDIEVAYPRTGNSEIDTLFAGWATEMVAEFEQSADEDFAEWKADNNGELPPWTYSLYVTFELPRNDAAMLL